jgi:hypothetical protein
MAGQIFEVAWKMADGEATPKRNLRPSSISDFTEDQSTASVTLTDSDVLELKSTCQLFREFLDGIRRLSNPERRILLSNLRWYRNGLPIYRQGLVRNPTESGHSFRRKAATHSDGRRPPIPREGGHLLSSSAGGAG